MAPTQDQPTLVPACPRCQYNQSGTVAAWPTDAVGAACPLQGRCPECGLDFACRDVLNINRHDNPNFYEHAHL